MKRAIPFVCIVCLMVCLFSCKSNDIKLNEDKCFFSNFKIEDEKVYFYCTLCIDNQSPSQKVVEIKAFFENDAENGLLKDAKTVGYAIDENTNRFTLHSGENQINVVFVGEYGGLPQKQDRRLPDRVVTEIQ